MAYWWDFGDGVTSDVFDPSHVYTQTGVYTVTLTATNALTTGTAQRQVVVGLPPLADFHHNGPVLARTPLQIINETVGATEFSWDFGDGLGLSLAEHPTHVYSDGGRYLISLIAANQFGDNEISQFVDIHYPVFLPHQSR